MSHAVVAARSVDHAGCDRLLDLAFAATFRRLLGRVPPGRGEGTRITRRHRRSGAHVLVVRDEGDEVRGVVHLQTAGSRSIAGPLAVDPAWQAPWRKGVARSLLDAAVATARTEGAGMIDSVTFPQSIPHFELYQPYGGPVFQALFLQRDLERGQPVDATVSGSIGTTDLGSLPPDEWELAVAGCRAVTDRVWPGFDLTADLHHVFDADIGEVVLARAGDDVVGFAVLHHGVGSEAFADEQLLVKHLYVDPGAPVATAAFHALLARAEELGRETGASDVGLMASSARRSTLAELRERGYAVTQLHQQMLWAPPGAGVEALSMFDPSGYALAEWR